MSPFQLVIFVMLWSLNRDIQTSTTRNSTSGACSFIAPNNSGVISLTDCGNHSLSASDRKLIQDLLPQLNRILHQQSADLRKQILADLQSNQKQMIEKIKRIISGLELQQNPSAPIFDEDAKEVILKLGDSGNDMRIPMEFLRTYHSAPINLAGFAPVVYVEGDRLFVDVDLWSTTNPAAPVQLRHNRLIGRPPDWDVNSNDTALEIVDSHNNPVFQLIYETKSRVTIKGAFRTSTGASMTISDTGVAALPDAKMLPKFHITPIFRHPAWKYPGQYAGN
jgi:hypothetical protein